MNNPTHFALLIGVDFYDRNPLSSCVRDANLVEAYLGELEKDKRINRLAITKLTAARPKNGEGDETQPPENLEDLATLDNIRAAFKKITSELAAGDHFYFHFSGHGTDLGDEGLALVPFVCEDLKNRNLESCFCLCGTELINLVNHMATKGVQVLLVLDCCFSGKVPRHGLLDGIRYLPCDFNAEIEDKEPPSQMPDRDFFGNDLIYRTASVDSNWLMNLNSYTILTACGPTESSYPLSLGNGHTYGCLTYLMVRTLKRLRSFHMSRKAIFRFICARFNAIKSQQSPQLKGRGEFAFYGHLNGTDDSIFPMYRSPSGKIVIEAGEIMGIRENDTVAIAPLSAFVGEEWDNKHRLVTVRNVGGVTAHLTIDKLDSKEIDNGWVARPHKVIDTPRLPSTRQHKHSQEQCLLPPGYTEATAPFRARINNQDQFEIYDYDGHIVNFVPLGQLAIHHANSYNQVYAHLGHLVKCHDIVTLRPQVDNTLLQQSIRVELHDESEKPLLAGVVNTTHGAKTVLSIQNNSEQIVYVNVFYLSQDWEILNLPAAGNASLLGKPKCEEFRLEIVFTVPENYISKGIEECEDVLKVFITTKSVPLDNLAIQPPTRWRGPDTSQRGHDSQDLWLAHTFHIRTTYKPES